MLQSVCRDNHVLCRVHATWSISTGCLAAQAPRVRCGLYCSESSGSLHVDLRALWPRYQKQLTMVLRWHHLIYKNCFYLFEGQRRRKEGEGERKRERKNELNPGLT